MAALVVWQQLDRLEFWFRYSPPLQIPGQLAHRVEAVAIILLPAALLFRTADASAPTVPCSSA